MELKPCPFCGNQPYVHENDWSEPPTWVAICDSTTCLEVHFTEAEAISAWNRRTPAPAAEGREAVLIEQCAAVLDSLGASVLGRAERTGKHLVSPTEVVDFIAQACDDAAKAIRALCPKEER